MRTKKKLVLFIIAFFALIVFCACVEQTPQNSDGLAVYYPVRSDVSASEPVITAVYYEDNLNNSEDKIRFVMDKLISPPEKDNVRTPINAESFFYTFTFKNGIVILDIRGQYGELAGMELTLADTCITLSLCGINGVDGVSILHDGKNHPNKSGEAMVLRKTDIVLQDLELKPLEQTVTLYFPDKDMKYLVSERFIFVLRENEQIERYVLEELFKGSERFKSAVPENTKILSISVENEICYLNLSGEFLEGVPEGFDRQRLTVLSIVNSLTDLPHIDKVRLMIDGSKMDYYGYVYIGKPMPFEAESVKGNALQDNRAEVILYYPVRETNLMAPVYRSINNWQNQNTEIEIVNLLLSINPPSWSSFLAQPQAEAESIIVADGKATVSFDREFYEEAQRNGGKTIDAIAATLLKLEGIDSVVFNLDCRPVEGFSYLEMEEPITRDMIAYIE